MENSVVRRLVMSVPALTLLCLWSCSGAGTSAAFDQLPDAERATYNRCWEHMRVPICGATTDMAAVLNCSRSSSGTYAAYTTAAEREAWLASHGCPPAVVSSGGSR